MTIGFRPMMCPVCNDFYFSELQEGDDINHLQCSRCGWTYNLSQILSPDEITDADNMTLNEYRAWYRKKIESDPAYDYSEETMPAPSSHNCPVCGHYKFPDNWSYDICPFCGWEDDGSDDGTAIGANGMSFKDYKKKYEEYIALDPYYRWDNDHDS